MPGLTIPKVKYLVAFPTGLAEEIDRIAKEEHRSRSDLIREMARRYVEEFKQKQSFYKKPAELLNTLT